MAAPWDQFDSGDTATATAPVDEQGPWSQFQPSEPSPVQPPDQAWDYSKERSMGELLAMDSKSSPIQPPTFESPVSIGDQGPVWKGVAPIQPPESASVLKQLPGETFGIPEATKENASALTSARQKLSPEEQSAAYQAINDKYNYFSSVVSDKPDKLAEIERWRNEQFKAIGIEPVGFNEPGHLGEPLTQSEQETLFGKGKTATALGTGQRFLQGTASSFVQPEMAPMLPGASKLVGATGRVLGASFLPQMGEQVVEKGAQAAGALSAGDVEGAIPTAIEAGGAGLMLAVPALASRGERAPVERPAEPAVQSPGAQTSTEGPSLQDRISELENDPNVTGKRFSGMNPDGTPKYEDSKIDNLKVRKLEMLKQLQAQPEMRKVGGQPPVVQPGTEGQHEVSEPSENPKVESPLAAALQADGWNPQVANWTEQDFKKAGWPAAFIRRVKGIIAEHANKPPAAPPAPEAVPTPTEARTPAVAPAATQGNVSVEEMKKLGSDVGADHYGREGGKDKFRFTDPTVEPGKPNQITFAVPEGADKTTIEAARKLALVRARVAEGIPEENVRISITPEQVYGENTIPSVIQVDEVKHPIAGNVFSANPEVMIKAGLDMPTRQELLKLPMGQYTLPEARAKIAEINKTKPAEPEQRMPPGPGAQTAGTDTPEGSQLNQLSNAIKLQSISPKEPFDNRLRAALDLAGKWGRGKDAVTATIGKLVATKDALWDSYTHLPVWDNFTTSIGRWIGADQRTAMEVRNFQKAITKTVPNKLRREAITNWIQAEGDEGVLQQRLNDSKGNVSRGYQTALNLNESEKTLARNIGSYFESRLQEGIDQGILKQGVDAYVNQIWQRPTATTQKLWADLFGGGTLNPNFKFAKQRIFESYFEGEQAGLIPKNKDIRNLIATYDMAFNRALSARAMIRELHEGKAKDGMPIVMTSGQGTPLPKSETPPEAILVKPNYSPKGAVTADGRPYRPVDHWALRDWKWVSKTGDTSVFVQGDMLVHPDHWTHLNNVLKTSRLRQNPVISSLLATGSFAKQTKLSLSPFHTVQEGVHSMAHRVNPVNPSSLDMADPVQKSLIDHGLMVADPRGYELFTEGMSGGGLVGKIPGLGALQQWYTEMTFKDYIPRLKMAMAKDALERNRTGYAKQIASGKITDDQIVALTARESNAAFGEQNYRMMGRSPTTQDFLRLSLLAPDFLEARARFVGQALKPYGREQRIALALMGATLYTGARILNKALDDDYHWSPKHAFSVFQNGKEYRLRTILGDVQHLITDPRSFWYNRLSPITRTASEYVTGRDDRGIKRSTMEQFTDFLSWFKPIPLQIRPGESAGQALLASAGVPARTYGKQQQLYEVLDNWRSKQTDPAIKEAYDRQRQETHVTSIYGPLRMALNSDNMNQAKTEYQKLLTSRTPARIRTALTPSRPFTGSKATEMKFKASLSPQEQKLYDEARAERVRLLNRFDQMGSAAPVPAPPPWDQFTPR